VPFAKRLDRLAQWNYLFQVIGVGFEESTSMKGLCKEDSTASSRHNGSGHQPLLYVSDQRQSAILQQKEQSMIDSSPRVASQRQDFTDALGASAYPRASHTTLPQKLKTGIETLSGMNLEDVRVFYNSGSPAGLGALAYTQGNEIHLGPGQEKWLPHEGWHIVQQRQGRVRPTTYKAGFPINDQVALEREADSMGTRAMRAGRDNDEHKGPDVNRGLNDLAFKNVYAQLKNGDTGPGAEHFLSDDEAAENALPNKSVFLAMLREQIEAAAEIELSAIDQTVENCPYIAYWFAHYQDLPASEIERAVRLYAPETRNTTFALEVISIIVNRVQAGLREQLATGTIDPVDKDEPSELKENGKPLSDNQVFQLGCCKSTEAVDGRQRQPNDNLEENYSPGTGELDRRGNETRDTEFETKLAELIYEEKELYAVHKNIAQLIADATNKTGKKKTIKTDDNLLDEGLDMKEFVEQHYAQGNSGSAEFWVFYDDLRKDFSNENDPKKRGRDKHKYDFESPHTGIMTPRSGSRVLDETYAIPYESKLGAYQDFKAPEEPTNKANDVRQQLGLPFGAGPSGSLVYSLAMLRHFKSVNPHVSEYLDDPDIEIKYALSLSAYLVRHGHHSFFEAMVPLLRTDFDSKISFYKTLLAHIGSAGFDRLQTKATKLFEGLYMRS
jgi:hypothetical protein